MVDKEPLNYHDFRDHRPDMTTLFDGFKIWDLKLLDPLGSTPGTSVAQRGAWATRRGRRARYKRGVWRGA